MARDGYGADFALRTGQHPGAVTALATGATIAASTPAFLVGASGPFLFRELGLDEAGLGLSIASYFLVSAVAAALGGKLSERMGPKTAFLLAASGIALVLLTIALFVDSATSLRLVLMMAGCLNGLCQPAANVALARYVTKRQGLMFGVKQSSILVATLFSGISVPLIAVQAGWRWSFVVGAGFALLLAFAVRLLPSERVKGRDEPAPPEPRRIRTSSLVGVAFAVALGTGSATAMASFLVAASVEVGLDVAMAGWLLGFASALGIVSRLTAGWFVDRRPSRGLRTVSWMLLLGSTGFLLLAVGRVTTTIVGASVAYVFGWGWSGLLMFSVARSNPGSVGGSTGVAQAGLGAGAAAGPWLFGIGVSAYSFRSAWLVCSAVSLLSALLIALADRRLRSATR